MYSRRGNISGNQYNPIKGSPSPLTQCLGVKKYFLLNSTRVEAIWISIRGGGDIIPDGRYSDKKHQFLDPLK